MITYVCKKNITFLKEWLAQLVELFVDIEKVVGSSPTSLTKIKKNIKKFFIFNFVITTKLLDYYGVF